MEKIECPNLISTITEEPLGSIGSHMSLNHACFGEKTMKIYKYVCPVFRKKTQVKMKHVKIKEYASTT